MHQYLDQLLARDAEVERAGEVRLQLVRASERRELGDRAEAPAAQVEVRACPEHPEDELRDEAEELGREPLRRELRSACSCAPELAHDLEPAREVVRRFRHAGGILR